jgi:phosphatidylglycerophosphate synthase
MAEFGDRFSETEETLRDRLLGPLVDFIMPGWITPNHLTALRAILVVLAIILYLAGAALQTQVFVLILASLTDLFDGILARVRSLFSRRGAYFDHGVDWFLGGWAGILALVNGLLPLAFILLIITAQLGITIVDRIRASRIPVQKKKERIITITMGAANFRPSAFSRIQFFAILTGFFLLLLGRVWFSNLLLTFGEIFLYAAAFLAWILLFDTSTRAIREKGSTADTGP